jgi:S-adenosyl-L-methionine methyltransferase
MSRLDTFIQRMTAQRDMLNDLAARGALADGPILELGLGNGRTYSHLRECFPERRIIVFDRAMGAHKTSAPPERDLVLGEIRDTARGFAGIGAALVHTDIGTGYPERDALTLQWLPQLASDLLAPGGFAASDLPLDHPLLEPLPPPPTVTPGRYFLYRRTAS